MKLGLEFYLPFVALCLFFLGSVMSLSIEQDKYYKTKRGDKEIEEDN